MIHYPSRVNLLALHRGLARSVPTRYLVFLVRYAAGGNHTSSVYPSYPNKHPRHRKRKYATFVTTRRLSTQFALTHVWTDPFTGGRCRVLSGAVTNRLNRRMRELERIYLIVDKAEQEQKTENHAHAVWRYHGSQSRILQESLIQSDLWSG